MKLKYIALAVTLSVGNATADEHNLSIKGEGGKPATTHTVNSNKEVYKTLNFNDVRAFENNAVGLIAEFDKKTGDIIRNSFNFIA